MLKILYVEDDKVQAEALSRLLMKVAPLGTLEIFHATNLHDALEQSVKIKASVTFLDLLIPLTADSEPIPATDWRKVARHIPDFYPPVIVITGLDDHDFEIEFECVVKQKAQAVYSKPKARRFFTWLGEQQQELFAEHLLSAAGRAALRAQGEKKSDRII